MSDEKGIVIKTEDGSEAVIGGTLGSGRSRSSS